MATFIGLPGILDDIVGIFRPAAITYQSAGLVRVSYKFDGYYFYFLDIRGSFTFGADGQLSGGVINQILDFVAYYTLYEGHNSKALGNIYGLNLPVADFLAYVAANDNAGLLAQAFSGDDVMQSTSGYGDRLQAFLGNDSVSGIGGDDTLDGGGGNDTLDGGAGRDRLIGGAGSDLYIQDSALDAIVEGGVDPGDELKTNQSLSIVVPNIEHYTFTGKAAVNFVGDGADNRITGSARGDTLVGAAGDDTLSGGGGGDSLVGGTGDDSYVIDNSADRISEAGGDGFDVVASSVAFELPAGIETLVLTGAGAISGTGNELDNLITGNTGANRLDGGLGADSLDGGRGNDTYVVNELGDKVSETLLGAGGIDLVLSDVDFALGDNLENLTLLAGAVAGTGNGFANVIIGNTADNLLDGEGGADKLTGQLGSDTYIVDDKADLVTEAAGKDTGDDTVKSTLASYTLGANVENLVLLAGATAGVGNSLNNKMTGNEAANMLDGKVGSDTMVGGDGDDIYVQDSVLDVIDETGNSAGDELRTNQGLSSVVTNVEHYTFTGSAAVNFAADGADNRLTGTAKNDALAGKAGNDTLNGGAGADSLMGGTGMDTYVVDNAKDIVDESGGDGIDNVQSMISYVLAGGLENLELMGTAAINGTGNADPNRLTGNKGANKLDGMAGADTMEGKDGNDTYIVGAGDQVIETIAGAAGGVDLALSAVSFDLSLADHAQIEKLTLADAANTDATGNTLANTLTGNAGNNRLDGKAGADTMAGGKGNDTYTVDNAKDAVTEAAGAGTDTVRSELSYTLGATLENLVLIGAALAATGNAGSNALTGNGLDNMLDGKAGADIMTGADGSDVYVVDNIGDQVIELAAQGTDEVRSSLGLTLIANIENYAYSGTKAQTFTDTDLGDHRITAGSGADKLTSGTGNDTLNGGAGADSLDGGAGNDTYVIDNAKDAISDSSGIDTVQSTLSVDLHLQAFAAIENVLLLGAGALAATGRDDANRLEGNTGANKLAGNGDADTLIGNAGNDTLDGGGGSDLLDGGVGADKLTGGADSDTFLRHNLAEGKDTITDFHTGPGGDVLDIHDLLVGYTAGHEAEFVQCVTAGGNTTVKVDADGLANGAKFTDVCVLTGVSATLDDLLVGDNLRLTA